jgi:hypothetical protein
MFLVAGTAAVTALLVKRTHDPSTKTVRYPADASSDSTSSEGTGESALSKMGSALRAGAEAAATEGSGDVEVDPDEARDSGSLPLAPDEVDTTTLREHYQELFLAKAKTLNDESERATWEVYCQMSYDSDAGGSRGNCFASDETCTEGGTFAGTVEYGSEKIGIIDSEPCESRDPSEIP